MSLLAAVEAVSQSVLHLLALLVGVVLRPALIAEPSFGSGAVTQEMLPRSALETSLLVALLVAEFVQFLLLLLQLLFDSSSLLFLFFSDLLGGINNVLLGGLQSLLKLGKLSVDAFAFGFVLLHLLTRLLNLQLGNPFPNVFDSQMYFLAHQLYIISPSREGFETKLGRWAGSGRVEELLR